MVSVLGTLHHHRDRWNPFAIRNVLQRASDAEGWLRWFSLDPRGGRHGDGIYTIRFILNHNPRRPLKLKEWQPTETIPASGSGAGTLLKARLKEDALGRGSENLSFRVHKLCMVCIRVNPLHAEAVLISDTEASLSPIQAETSYELNGFIWDELDAFTKFDERRPGRSFQRHDKDHWQINVPLRRDGGIDFRHDGIYQFLISRNGDEDQGLAALNSAAVGNSLELVAGSGFGSSHGTCQHSAPTIRVSEDGEHAFSLFRQGDGYRLSVQSPAGQPVPFCNHNANTIQLLGTVFSADSFDPNQAQAAMCADINGGCFSSELALQEGTYSINFAIGNELFLDTMGLGCWLAHDGPGLRGIGWHGKPNEVNILFTVKRSGQYGFTYDRCTDQFSIEPLFIHAPIATKPLEAVTGISSLSLVGNFEAPLDSWQPQSDANLMSDLGGQRFEKMVHLKADTTYEFKFVANRTNWLLVFADYEYDGYGLSYDVLDNPRPFDSRLSELKRHGHLTTHGNPPAISFRTMQSGWYRFAVDLNSGAYAIRFVA
jgi:hypothetical protein